MTAEPSGTVDWGEAYRRRAALDPLRAVLDPGDPDNVKNAYVDRLEREHLGRVLGPGPLGTVVDVGAGVGRLTPFLADRAERVLGLDLSEDLLRAARGRGVPAGAGFVRGNVRRLPVRDGAAGVVVSCGVMCHMVEDAWLAEVAGEMRRILRPGGRAVFIEHVNRDPVTERREGIVFRSVADFLRPFEAMGFLVEAAGPLRKSPSRLIHWARKGWLPRPLWGLAARLEPWLATRGRVPPDYRDHLFLLRRP